ncbi:MAG: glycosyltransferase [Deltaproteobacteria bacterium]
MIWNVLAFVPLFIWCSILLLPWKPWRTKEVLDADPGADADPLQELTVLIPARNEAQVIDRTLRGVRAQGPDLRIILVDDQSTDDTARTARQSGSAPLLIIEGQPPTQGWSGKLWALEQGLKQVHSEWVLLLDADIELAPGIVSLLLKKAKTEGLEFISLMARLRMQGFWERLLMPAFIYFFKLLYPFRRSNTLSSKVAAAAGGCILLETALLRRLGGFEPIRDALIDDCALAGAAKSLGAHTWIGLTHSAKSLRAYGGFREISNMVARTAFYQLRYSVSLLFFLTLAMTLLFWIPVVGFGFPSTGAKILSALSLTAMMASYLPTLRFYGLPMGWSAALPLVGTLYLAMTWISAIRFWRGLGARWKGRAYGAGDI